MSDLVPDILLPDAVMAGTRADDVEARVRLGASADAAPALLERLAADRAVTVRAAVAMNPQTPRCADALLAIDEDERVRRLLGRKLALLLPEIPPSGRDPQQDHTLRLLHGMIEDAAVRVRAAIAEAVKAMPEVPRTLILRLACDGAMAVCGPVIRMSPLLGDADLMALLTQPPAAVTGTAVAHRPRLAAELCDRIAAGDHDAAIGALLANPTAAIREQTLDGLVARAADRADWHAPLVRRPSLSAGAIQGLSEMVTARLLEELSVRADIDPGLAARLRARRDRPDSPAAGRAEPSMEEAIGEARHLFARGELDEAVLQGAVQRGEVRMATALLAVAAEVSGSVVDRAATLRSAKGLVSLIWKAGFSMRVAIPLQSLLARIDPSALLRPGPGDAFPLAIEEMRWQLDFLAKMGR